MKNYGIRISYDDAAILFPNLKNGNWFFRFVSKYLSLLHIKCYSKKLKGKESTCYWVWQHLKIPFGKKYILIQHDAEWNGSNDKIIKDRFYLMDIVYRRYQNSGK